MWASLRNKTFHLPKKNVGDFAALRRLGLQQILLHALQQDKLHVLTKAVLEKKKKGYIVSSSLSSPRTDVVKDPHLHQSDGLKGIKGLHQHHNHYPLSSPRRGARQTPHPHQSDGLKDIIIFITKKRCKVWTPHPRQSDGLKDTMVYISITITTGRCETSSTSLPKWHWILSIWGGWN